MAYHPINLGIRFVIELVALASFAMFGWRLGDDGPLRFGLAILLPVLAGAVWAIFAVPGDPSRSGAAPFAVPGVVRLGLELLFFAAAAWILAGRSALWAGVLVAAIVIHYAVSIERILWLLGSR